MNKVRFGKNVVGCQGFMSRRCSCGIRSMATLSDLAAFLVNKNHIRWDPPKATVVGRIRIGGRAQTTSPADGIFGALNGYQRSEYARVVGPLYVSPLGSRWADGLRDRYEPGVEVISSDESFGGDMTSWIENLAASVGADEG